MVAEGAPAGCAPVDPDVAVKELQKVFLSQIQDGMNLFLWLPMHLEQTETMKERLDFSYDPSCI